MRVTRREFFNGTRRDVWRIIPLGDVHIGAAACDEKLFKSVIKRIQDDDTALWGGMGDYCEFINMADRRFDPATLAPWIETADLVDLGKAQRDYFLDHIKPIAHKCLWLLEGNHEATIQRRTERAVYNDIVATVKGWAGLPNEQVLGLGRYGWAQLIFRRGPDRQSASSMVTFNLHHGFTGGKLAGGKALNMQRWLWTHNADLVLMGHSHNTLIQPEAVSEIDRGGNVITKTRCGAFAGSFLKNENEGPSTYSEDMGFFPLPYGGVEIQLRPGLKKRRGRIRLIYEM